ncbi:hypothetical protein Misp01_01550 [Microtetraspora sp. NBRC 13810]|uniref:hypothetical protein n=1 Tax=Microtetraspora sp. NBRC 13810 TaxID=3030990 RepID=UPI0024A4B653|nr:hypothetical protein [Microtetraspora sp. NBRC 13810]GLW05025.1 hypothetical protein Misp01_01550 [Microtetraspora sp. NBRC 13810]
MAYPTEPGAGAPYSPVTDVTPADLVSRKDDFHDEKAALDAALTNVANRLASLGAFWGGDEDGVRFYDGDPDDGEQARGYRAAAAEALAHISDLRDAYLLIGHDLVTAGANLAGADWQAVADMIQVMETDQAAIDVPTTKARVE